MSAYFYAKVSQEVRTISKENKINEEIRDRELRVIDNEGKMLGVMSRDEALALAEEKKLDLVNISPNANPPVCKILDLSLIHIFGSKRSGKYEDGLRVQRCTV